MKSRRESGKAHLSVVDGHMLETMKKSRNYTIEAYAKDMFDKDLYHVVWREKKARRRTRAPE